MINYKLIPMVDFVLQKSAEMYERVKKKEDNAVLQFITETPNYANFLKQEIAVWMFVPCDESGNILPEPERHEERNSFDEVDYDFDAQELHDYIKAKERCLFQIDNYEIADDVVFINNKRFMIIRETGIFHRLNKTYITLEDLANEEQISLWLSETAIKKIGL